MEEIETIKFFSEKDLNEVEGVVVVGEGKNVFT